ncbi:MAG: hypothetical protein ACK5Q5_00230 [Planctomycetaceae bacterium]
MLGNAEELDAWAAAARRCGAAVSGDAAAEPASVDKTSANLAILGGGASDVLKAARLVGESMPLLVLPDAVAAGAIAYGLLPDAEDGRVLTPGWSLRCDPAVQDYLKRFIRGELGDLQVVQFEREVDCRAEPQPQRLTTDVVNHWYFQDVDLLRLVGGDFVRVTAVPLAPDAQGCRRMTITLGTDGTAETVWSLLPGDRHDWKLTISGTRGTAELRQSGLNPVELVVGGVRQNTVGPDGREAVLRSLLQPGKSVGNVTGPSAEGVFPETLAVPVWSDFVRAADLLEGYQRSLRRRRTIDLHLDSHSERSQFKTQMTTIGCGILTWAFLGTCLGLIVGGAFDPRDSTERRAAAAGTIVWETDFTAGGTTLSEAASASLLQQAAMDGAEAIVLIEQQGNPGLSRVDSDRLTAVEELMHSSPETKRAQLTVRPLAGGWFRLAMLGIWLAAFLPLGIFLALQLLLMATRPAAESTAGS